MLGPQSHLVARYLDLLSQRQQVTAENIANVDTPGYRTRDIAFQSELREALADPKHAGVEPAAVHEAGGLPVKNDGNDVTLERELRNLSETGMKFTHGLSMLQGQIRSIRSAIREGRG